MITRSKSAGQSTAEYAVLIAIVIAAAVGMQTYVKRGLQAKLKDASDSLTSNVGGTGNFSLPTLHQYEPYYARSDFNVTQTQNRTESMVAGKLSGGVERTGVVEVTSRAIATGSGTNTQTGFQAQGNNLQTDDTSWPEGDN